jgi:hypothetical protein
MQGEHLQCMEGQLIRDLSQPMHAAGLSTFSPEGNRSSRKKPTTFGRALTDSFNECLGSGTRIESTIMLEL